MSEGVPMSTVDTQVLVECTAAAESHCTDWAQYKASGDNHTITQQWKTAIDCYDEALKTVPTDPPQLAGSLWACRARCNAELGDSNAALKDVGQSVRLQGASASAICSKARSFVMMEKWEDGLDCAEHS